jgi:hypothetical protein
MAGKLASIGPGSAMAAPLRTGRVTGTALPGFLSNTRHRGKNQK